MGFSALLLAGALLAAAPAVPEPALLHGRIVKGDAPVTGARVAAYPLTSSGVSLSSISLSSIAPSPLRTLSAPTAADGLYSLRLPPGRFAVTAMAGELWSYSGQNPVELAPGAELRLGFELLSWEPVASKPEKGAGEEGTIRGRVTLEGKGVAGVTVSLYLDAADAFRGPAVLSVPAEEDGRFELSMIPPSRYYLVARRRGSGSPVGPMLQGDLFGYHRENPLPIEAGTALTVTLPLLHKRLDRDVNALGVPSDEPRLAGTVRDRQGKPVAGVHAFAYREPEMGHHKPAAVSSLTDEEGRYVLFLPGPGRYYLGARAGFGDSPAPGEWFGFWEGNAEHAVELPPGGSLPGADITVDKVLE